MIFKKLVKELESNPKKLFFLDALGAILSAFILGRVLVKFEPIFGIPKSTLYFLSSIPLVFSIYDFYCYSIVTKSHRRWLKPIAFANLFYCCLSLSLAYFHKNEITLLGGVYISLEVLIIVSLAFIELRVAKKT